MERTVLIRKRKQSGAALAETSIAVFLMLLPFGIFAIQTGLLINAKSAVNYAALLAARQGAMYGADLDRMEEGFRAGIIPLLRPTVAAAVAEDDNISLTWWNAAKANLDASLDNENLEITILNPTKEAFIDHGVEVEGGTKRCDESSLGDAGYNCLIPNDILISRPRAGVAATRSKTDVQTANLLRVRVRYGYPIETPFASSVLKAFYTSTDSLFTYTPFEQALIDADPIRIPIESVATVRMQSPAYYNNNVLEKATVDAMVKAK